MSGLARLRGKKGEVPKILPRAATFRRPSANSRQVSDSTGRDIGASNTPANLASKRTAVHIDLTVDCVNNDRHQDDKRRRVGEVIDLVSSSRNPLFQPSTKKQGLGLAPSSGDSKETKSCGTVPVSGRRLPADFYQLPKPASSNNTGKTNRATRNNQHAGTNSRRHNLEDAVAKEDRTVARSLELPHVTQPIAAKKTANAASRTRHDNGHGYGVRFQRPGSVASSLCPIVDADRQTCSLNTIRPLEDPTLRGGQLAEYQISWSGRRGSAPEGIFYYHCKFSIARALSMHNPVSSQTRF